LDALLDAALQIVAAAVLVLGGFAVRALTIWLNLRADDQVRGYLQQALDRAVEYGISEARRRVRDGAEGRGSQANIAAELARDYAQQRVPDALARFGIDTAGLDQLIRARMPKPPSFPGSP
jgi:hypothetical protein